MTENKHAKRISHAAPKKNGNVVATPKQAEKQPIGKAVTALYWQRLSDVSLEWAARFDWDIPVTEEHMPSASTETENRSRSTYRPAIVLRITSEG